MGSTSKKLFVEDVMRASLQLTKALKGLSIGALIKEIRIQLGMTQVVLARRAGVPQSTISRIERSPGDMSTATLSKILQAISCELVIAPLLNDSIVSIRKKQAKKVAEKHIRYLAGTMHLEKQKPDVRFMKRLLNEEVDRLLRGPGRLLWEE